MLIRPAPFPEELDRGYLGRVMRFNGTATAKETETLMSIWAGVADKSRREVSCLELLSKVADVELPQFARQHSTLPFRRGITSYQPDLPHGSESSRSMLWTTGMRMARTGVYFCAECAREDQDFHGESYWRREHQLPGLLWCSKHTTALKYVEHKHAFSSPPAANLHHCQAIDETWAKEAFDNQFIQRFLEISFGLMDREAPLDVKRVSTILKAKAKASASGFQTCGGKVKAPLLSDAVITEFGRPWLATILPRLADKPAGILLNQLDGVLFLTNSASSVSAYILASALLFESADTALNALQASQNALQGSQIGIKRYRQRSPQIGRDQLIDAYIEARGNYLMIATLLSISRYMVIVKYRDIGLPNLNEGNKSLLKAAVAFFVEEQSVLNSAAKGGCSVEAMEALIRNSGGEFTSALREMSRPSRRGSGIRRARQLTPGEATRAETG
jgi:hypothetical protein